MTIPPIEVTAVLNASRSKAFSAFVANAAQWWPLETHSVSPSLGEGTPENLVIEPFEGGRIYEISTSGTQRLWGTITRWEKDSTLAFTWHPGKDAELATSVSVSFATTDDGKTAVTLVHSNWDVLGETAKDMRDNYNSGWAAILQTKYAAFAEGTVSA